MIFCAGLLRGNNLLTVFLLVYLPRTVQTVQPPHYIYPFPRQMFGVPKHLLYSSLQYTLALTEKMFSSLKRFDFHVKTVDGVNQQTILGAVLTIISTILISVLIISEISSFMTIDVVSRMITDKSAGMESVKMEFDLHFKDIACDRISFTQEVTRGALHIHGPGVFQKNETADGMVLGCHVHGANLIDKVGGNFRLAISPQFSATDQGPGNFSHTVNRVAFVSTLGVSAADKLPGLPENLFDEETIVPVDTRVYHYAIQVNSSPLTQFVRAIPLLCVPTVLYFFLLINYLI